MTDAPQDQETVVADAERLEDAAPDDATDPLATAIAENPEEVARFVRRVGLVNDLLDTADLATKAMDDDMVVRLAERGALLAEAADGLATRETAAMADTVGANADELNDALETLVDLQRAGTLDDIADLANGASLLHAALDDEMVTTLARTGTSLGELADVAADPDTVRGVETLLRAVGDASDPADPPERLGAVGLVRSLRDPEVKRGLGYLVAVAKATGHDLDRQDAARE